MLNIFLTLYICGYACFTILYSVGRIKPWNSGMGSHAITYHRRVRHTFDVHVLNEFQRITMFLTNQEVTLI
jgi:hypothetical protein